MSASREGYNLFGKYGWYHFKKNKVWKSKYLIKLCFEDTIMPIVCKIIGHKIYNDNEGCGTPEYACKRCHQFINMESK